MIQCSLYHVKNKLKDMTNPRDQELCFNYKNLQPLEGSENVSKGAKFCEDEKAMYVAEYETATM